MKAIPNCLHNGMYSPLSPYATAPGITASVTTRSTQAGIETGGGL